MLEKFIAKNFISFYKDREKYLLLNQKIKNKKLIDEEYKEFEDKKDLEAYILNIENPQKYVITFLANENIGVVDSCAKADYKKRNIELNNVKIVCINNKYSFYATIYDLVELEKKFKFEVDLIYSIFTVIDFKASKKNNLYMIVTDEFCALIIYENSIPKYADILMLIESEPSDEEQIEEIDEIDILDDLSDDINDEIEEIGDIEDIDLEEAAEHTTSIEADVIEFLKSSIKEYYKISDTFVENIIVFNTTKLNENFAKIIEDGIFIETQIEEFNLLKTLNEIGQVDV